MAVVRTGNGPHHVRDIGPAAAAVDGMSAMGRLSALRVDRGALVADTAAARGAGPIERRYLPRAKEDPVTIAPTPPAAVPCGTCLHAPVCRLRAMLDDLGPLAPVQVIEHGLRAVATTWVLECDHHLAAATDPQRPRLVPTADQVAESRRRGAQATKTKKAEAREKAERAAAVMAALARHDGDRAAAARELGMKLNALTMVAKYAEGRLGAGAGA